MCRAEERRRRSHQTHLMKAWAASSLSWVKCHPPLHLEGRERV